MSSERELFHHHRSVSFEGLDHDNDHDDGNNIPIVAVSSTTNISETTAEEEELSLEVAAAAAAAAAVGRGEAAPPLSTGGEVSVGGGDGSISDIGGGGSVTLPPIPQRTHPISLKEKLVERERQARVETERARLKRQFALLENGGGLDDDELIDDGGDLSAIREHGSVVGTVGEESTAADNIIGDDGDDNNNNNNNDDVGNNKNNNIIDNNETNGPVQNNAVTSIDEQQQQQQQQQSLGYPMERFLAESTNKSSNKRPEPRETSVVMERFLHEPPVVVVDDAQQNGNDDLVPPSINAEEANNVRHDNYNVTFVIPNTSGNQDDTVATKIANVDLDRNINNNNNHTEEVVTNGSDNAPVAVREGEDMITGAASDINASAGSVRSYSTVSDDALLGNRGDDDDDDDDDNDLAPAAVILTTTTTSVTSSAPPTTTIDDTAVTNSNQESNSRVENISVQSVASSQVAFQSETTSDDEDGRLLSQEDQNPSSAASADTPPRLFRLTEREIEEMAAIEEASIGNAPPSDRDESSLVGDVLGELVTGTGVDLEHTAVRGGGGGGGTTGTFSEQTRSTAIESTSSNNQSINNDAQQQSSIEADDDDDDGDVNINIHATASVSSHLALSPTASNDEDSITAMPPSESDRAVGDDNHHHNDQSRNLADVEDLSSIPESNNNNNERQFILQHQVSSSGLSPLAGHSDGSNNHRNNDSEHDELLLNAEAVAAANAGVVNRTQRPGMVVNVNSSSSSQRRTLQSSTTTTTTAADNALNSSSLSAGMKKSSSMPLMVDGFDFDKYDDNILSPRSCADDSLRDLPGDELWNLRSASSESTFHVPPGESNAAGAVVLNRSRATDELWHSSRGTMSISPIRKGVNVDRIYLQQQAGNDAAGARDAGHVVSGVGARNGNYGSAPIALEGNVKRKGPIQARSNISSNKRGNDIETATRNEQQPLLGIPDLVTMPTPVQTSSRRRSLATLSLEDVDDMVNSVFSSVRSVSTADVEEDMKESDLYLASSTFARAFPERMIALIVTLIIEIPVLLMISGGSDRLCELIGRSKYQLLMAFLPLSSAISGNCGLQASTLTTRAISHSHVTRTSYMKWLRTEIGAALYLGIGLGVVIGSIAYIASGYDLSFGITLFTAQVVSIFTAGCTGTLAPLLFTFIFHRDSGKWGGPLETAVQDIVGSFAMVVLSYQLLKMTGPKEIPPNDMCGNA